MLNAVFNRWRRPNGYKDVLVLAIPLIVTTSSSGLQSFIDRIFLSWFDSNALAATVPAFLVCFTLSAVFLGIASYASVFVAQYYGAKQFNKIGAVVWQGFYTVGLSLIVVAPVFFYLEPIFHLIGHDPVLQVMEVSYAKVLILSVPISIVSGALSGFFSGISRTSVVMWSNLLITLINLVLDYALIFGHWGFPVMGVAGAAWATVIALSIGTVVQLSIFFQFQYRDQYSTLYSCRFDKKIFKKLIILGFPAGIQVQMQSLAWTLFVLFIGKIGVVALTAHSIAMNIFMLAVMPMAGMSIAVSVLVGQSLGRADPASAERASLSAIHVAAVFFIIASFFMLFFPEWFINPFSKGMTLSVYQLVLPEVKTLLALVALLCLLEAASMMIAGALKGAGDTLFVAWVGVLTSWFVLVLPTALILYLWGGHLLWSWVFFVCNGFFVCLFYTLRFRAKKWHGLRVIS